MGGSFLGGWLAGDLATRGPDRGAEADKLSDELQAERQRAASSDNFSMGLVGAVVGWKATAHNLRARLQARRETEEDLLEQLTAADMRVPLSDPDTFDKVYDEKYAKTFTDPDVVSKTYDGDLPPNLAEEHENWKKEKGIE